MSWNPDFPRKRKRNRVSRGKPQRRRYFFIPTMLLLLVVLGWRSGLVAGTWQRVFAEHKPVEAVVVSETDWITTKLWEQHWQIQKLQEQIRASERPKTAQQHQLCKSLKTDATAPLGSTCVGRDDGQIYYKVGVNAWANVSAPIATSTGTGSLVMRNANIGNTSHSNNTHNNRSNVLYRDLRLRK